MPDHRRRFRPHAPALSLAAFALLVLVFILSPVAAHARQRGDHAAREARRTEMQMRQRALWDLEKLKNARPARMPDRRPAYREVAEEFQQLQLVNYSLAGASDPKVPLDYAQIRKQSSEVRKRAARLKDYLLLPELDEAQKPHRGEEMLTPETLRAAVGALDVLVKSFVWNPVFQRPDVVDLEQSSKASRDLAGILSLSEQIRRSAEELGRVEPGVAKR